MPGLGWGLREKPASYYHPDEDRVARIALRIFHQDPADDYYPDGFPRQIAFFAHLPGIPQPSTGQDLVSVSRSLSVGYDLMGLVLTGLIALRLTGRRDIALAAALAHALSGQAITHATYGVTDSATAAWIALSVYGALLTSERPAAGLALSAGAAGVALGIKLPWPALLPPLLAIAQLPTGRRRWALLVPLALAGAFVLTNSNHSPEDLRHLWHMVRTDNLHAMARHRYELNPPVWLLELPVGMGLPAFFLACTGGIAIARRLRANPIRAAILPWAIAVAPLLGFTINYCMMSLTFPRHLVSTVTLTSALAGVGWSVWVERAGSPTRRRFLLIALLAYQVLYVASLIRPYWCDTRQKMDRWIAGSFTEPVRTHLGLFASLQKWNNNVRHPNTPHQADALLLHEEDYRRYLRSPLNPCTRKPDLDYVFHPSRHAEIYRNILRRRSAFVETKRFTYTPWTPELWLRKRCWGAFPEFVGDTVLYQRTPPPGKATPDQ